MFLRYVLVSLGGGILFGMLDGLLHANPLAQKLYEPYKPIARESLDIIAGLMIDLVYGFLLAAIFLLLQPSLPGDAGLLKGLSYGLLVWFFRVVMYAASNWVMFKIPGRTLLYDLGSGLLEMLALGCLYGLTLAT